MPKLLLAQLEPILFDKSANLQKMHDVMKRSQEADLILFPELFLTGYYTREKTRELAEAVNGPSIQQMMRWAKECRVKVIFGFPEYKGEAVYNSACFINEQGEVLGTYQKVHLWDEEGKYFRPGTDFPVWETTIGKIGIMICYDTEFPETARQLALNGADMILAPTANMTPFEHIQQIYIQSRAAENQIFVATTNRTGEEESAAFFGESAAANPFGQLICKGDREEGLYWVDVDLNLVKQSRTFPNYLKDRSPGLYKGMTESNA